MSELVKVNQGLAVQDNTRFEAQEAYLQNLIDGKILPKHITTTKAAFLVAEYGRELGFSTLQSFHYIIPITGKMTLSALAIGALLRSKGIKFKCTEDGVWVYADGKTSLSQDRGAEKPVDRRTTVIFTRDGDTEEASFYWSDAVKAGLTAKENWTRMPKEMLYARAMTKGAKRIAQDVMLGLYETGEILDYSPAHEVKGIKAKYNEDGGVETVEYEVQ